MTLLLHADRGASRIEVPIMVYSDLMCESREQFCVAIVESPGADVAAGMQSVCVSITDTTPLSGDQRCLLAPLGDSCRGMMRCSMSRRRRELRAAAAPTAIRDFGRF